MAAGLLPMRDEQLAAFERWLQRALSGIDDASDQRLIRSYTWGRCAGCAAPPPASR